MLFKLLFLFVVVPLVELTLLLMLAQRTSALTTLAVVLITGFVGTLLARAQGWSTFRRIQVELSSGKMPTTSLLDAAMIFVAGALLLTPGMLTDAVGLSLLVSPCRRWYRKRLLAWIQRNFKVQQFYSGAPDSEPIERSRIIDSYVVDSPTSSGNSPEQSNGSR